MEKFLAFEYDNENDKRRICPLEKAQVRRFVFLYAALFRFGICISFRILERLYATVFLLLFFSFASAFLLLLLLLPLSFESFTRAVNAPT